MRFQIFFFLTVGSFLVISPPAYAPNCLQGCWNVQYYCYLKAVIGGTCYCRGNTVDNQGNIWTWCDPNNAGFTAGTAFAKVSMGNNVQCPNTAVGTNTIYEKICNLACTDSPDQWPQKVSPPTGMASSQSKLGYANCPLTD